MLHINLAVISAVRKQYVYRLFIVALIGIKFCMYANTNVTIPGAKFPKHWFKNRYKITKKKRFAYNSWTQCNGIDKSNTACLSVPL